MTPSVTRWRAPLHVASGETWIPGSGIPGPRKDLARAGSLAFGRNNLDLSTHRFDLGGALGEPKARRTRCLSRGKIVLEGPRPHERRHASSSIDDDDRQLTVVESRLDRDGLSTLARSKRVVREIHEDGAERFISFETDDRNRSSNRNCTSGMQPPPATTRTRFTIECANLRDGSSRSLRFVSRRPWHAITCSGFPRSCAQPASIRSVVCAGPIVVLPDRSDFGIATPSRGSQTIPRRACPDDFCLNEY